jgi:hypothetical protein
MLATLVVLGLGVVTAAPAQADFTTTFISKWNGKCLDADNSAGGGNGTKVQLWSCHDGLNQDWRMVSLGNNFYRVVNVQFNRCLDAHAPDVARNGAKVQLWDCSGSDNQKWYLHIFSNGSSTLENWAGINATPADVIPVLDADRNNPNNGTRTQLWDFSGASNQLWQLGAV